MRSEILWDELWESRERAVVGTIGGLKRPPISASAMPSRQSYLHSFWRRRNPVGLLLVRSTYLPATTDDETYFLQDRLGTSHTCLYTRSRRPRQNDWISPHTVTFNL